MHFQDFWRHTDRQLPDFRRIHMVMGIVAVVCRVVRGQWASSCCSCNRWMQRKEPLGDKIRGCHLTGNSRPLSVFQKGLTWALVHTQTMSSPRHLSTSTDTNRTHRNGPASLFVSRTEQRDRSKATGLGFPALRIQLHHPVHKLP